MCDDKEIEFDLMENGLDFIFTSLEKILQYNKENKKELKYSLLHISSGTELILKEILRKEHWSLIFQDTTKANRKSLENGDFTSVGLIDSIDRLHNIVELKDLKEKKPHFKELKRKRNMTEHFIFKGSPEEIKGIVAETLDELIDLINDNIDIESYSQEAKNTFDSIRKKSGKFNKFIQERMDKIEPEIKSLKKSSIKVVECPKCFQEALPLDAPHKCLFCGYSEDIENIALAYYQNILEGDIYIRIKDGGSPPVSECPECDMPGLLELDSGYMCFQCSSEWKNDDLKSCSTCGNLYEPHEADLSMCKNCNDARIAKIMKE